LIGEARTKGLAVLTGKLLQLTAIDPGRLLAKRALRKLSLANLLAVDALSALDPLRTFSCTNLLMLDALGTFHPLRTFCVPNLPTLDALGTFDALGALNLAGLLAFHARRLLALDAHLLPLGALYLLAFHALRALGTLYLLTLHALRALGALNLLALRTLRLLLLHIGGLTALIVAATLGYRWGRQGEASDAGDQKHLAGHERPPFPSKSCKTNA